MSAPGIRIRPESLSDLPAISRVTAAAFRTASCANPTEEFIVGALRKAGKLTVSRVAIQDDEVVGHVAASPITLSGEAGSWYGLGPVSVLPTHQRRGIGSALIMDALLALSGSGASGCVVLGSPTFYERFGFQATAALTLPGVPPENFMAVAFDSSLARGIVSYHEAFQARN